MAIDERPADSAEAAFSFATRELERAQEMAARAQRERAPAEFDLEVDGHAAADRGFDPYNSTGRFDRNNAWARIRKR